MKKIQTRILVLAMIIGFVSAGLFMPGLIGAGDMEPSASPNPTMHTLEDIYNAVTVGCPREALVEKTGQTTSYRTGDDGDKEAGESWPNPRFTDNSDGTVTDNLTGLIWLKQADYNSIASGGQTGTANWNTAVDFCKELKDGDCGLTDSSSAGEWRLPNVKELQSLIHYEYDTPAVPNTAGTGQLTPDDPFTEVQSDYYWSSTTYSASTSSSWSVRMSDGRINGGNKSGTCYVWPVRGGQ